MASAAQVEVTGLLEGEDVEEQARQSWKRATRVGLVVSASLATIAAVTFISTSRAAPSYNGGRIIGESSVVKLPAAHAPAAHALAPAAHAPAKVQASSKKPAADAKYAHCPLTGGDCRKTECCQDPGTQCFAKNQYWAECRSECAKGMHLTDPDDTPWTCDTLGEKTPGEPKTCSKDGEDCRKTQCCAEAGMQCYAKDEFWAVCKPMCTPGPDLMAPDSDPWSCQEMGMRNPGAGKWVAEKCATHSQDCSESKCCAQEGMQCFRKDGGWSECRSECKKGFKENTWDQTGWACDVLGPVTPRFANAGEQPKGKVADWVADKCKGEGEDCSSMQCCKSVGWQCYKKNDFWSQCLWECPAAPVTQPAPARLLAATTKATAPKEETWDCSPQGQKSWGLSVKGYPSLYCLSLYMPSSYEGGIINQQLKMDAGIFACDGYDVVAAEDVTVGTTKDGVLVKTLVIEKVEVGVSQDGTAGNAKLFMAMWDKIISGKRFRDYDWTIKADPDAVLVPWRMREHMAPYVGQSVYVVNCNKFPSSPNFPMMYGSVEIFSSGAMIAYAEGSWRCGQELPWKSWGEDYYMTHCLDYLSVGRISEFTVVGDNVCTGANCADGSIASFHPFKTPEDWKKCWWQAVPA